MSEKIIFEYRCWTLMNQTIVLGYLVKKTETKPCILFIHFTETGKPESKTRTFLIFFPYTIDADT